MADTVADTDTDTATGTGTDTAEDRFAVSDAFVEAGTAGASGADGADGVRPVDPVADPAELADEVRLRPRRLDEFLGQAQLTEH
ncbi:MAG: hypothetical protein ACRDY1_16605, partial [Acidimicrobiales bacterium]